MTDTRYIYDLRKMATPQKTHWEVWFTDSDDKNWAHAFPEVLPHHIAAAYGVDPSSATVGDEVLDIILHQAHIPDFTDPVNFEADVAYQRGRKVTLKRDTPHQFSGAEAPIHLYTSKDTAEAREIHLLRIAEVKKQVTYVSAFTLGSGKVKGLAATKLVGITQDPVDNFRKGHGITIDTIAEHTLFVETQRRAAAGLPKLVTSRTRASITVPADPLVSQDHARRFLEIARDQKISKVPEWVKAALPADEIAALTSTGM